MTKKIRSRSVLLAAAGFVIAGMVAGSPRLPGQIVRSTDMPIDVDTDVKTESPDHFNQAIQQNSKDWQALFQRGYAYLRYGKYAESAADFSRVIELKPKALKAYAFRGEDYAHLGKFDDAGADLDLAQQIAVPNLHLAIFLISARAYLAMGETEKAIAAIDQAKLIPSTDIPANNNLAWFLATSSVAEMRDGKKAVELATKACTAWNWKLPGQMDTLAAAYAEAGDFDNAVKFESQCLQSPNLNPAIADGCKARLALYQAHQPFRQGNDAVGK